MKTLNVMESVVGGRAVAGVLATFSLMVSSSAAVLTMVPMQGGMVMPMISYDAAEDRLHVVMDDRVPQLTPLLVSHPGDSFDPSDPWYDSLDPSRQGLAFSRRYGFVMDAITDPLPNNRAIWIRKLTGSPGLGFYRYKSTDPKAWEPIFGTAGSSPAMAWSGMMFHPGVAAVPGTNGFTAAFEGYLVDPGSGADVPDSSTGPFVLTWTNIPDGRPELGIGMRKVIFWPSATAGYTLEGTDDLTQGIWTPVTNAPVVLEGQSAIVVDPGDARQFFRMKWVP